MQAVHQPVHHFSSAAPAPYLQTRTSACLFATLTSVQRWIPLYFENPSMLDD